MSLQMNVYLREIDDTIIPKWMERMNTFDMDCAIHPNFSFLETEGFTPFKLKLHKANYSVALDKEYISGIEIHRQTFDYDRALLERKANRNLFQRLFGREKNLLANASLDAKLKEYTTLLSFTWGGNDSFELRMALLSSAIITEIADGVCSYPSEDIWYENDTIVTNAFKGASDYERSLKEEEWKLHKFEGWDSEHTTENYLNKN